MNPTTNDPQKTAVIKTLAIIGFIAALIFLAWLAVQAVRLVPTAFNTLASIANGLKEDKTDFIIANDKKTINTGDTLTISWTKLAQDGVYVFSYRCTDGVVAEMRNTTGELVNVACDSGVTLPADNQSVGVIFSSERGRFVDVHYTIQFMPEGTDVASERDGVITVVNPGISPNAVASNVDAVVETNTTGMPIATSTTTESAEVTPNDTPAIIEPVQPTTPPAPTFRTVPVVVTTMPVSNPNGFADLAVTFIGVGTYNANTKTFSAQSSLDEDARAALRFEVKNIGTKTSESWSFAASLPTDPAFTYRSPAELALKPNERQVVTLQFDPTREDSSARSTVTVTGGNDLRTGNNSFSREISISN